MNGTVWPNCADVPLRIHSLTDCAFGYTTVLRRLHNRLAL